MNNLDPEIQKSWKEMIARAKPPQWVQDMHRYYQQTGNFRPEDLRRLLGDPNQRVEIGPHSTLATAMSQKQIQGKGIPS